jgi:hypothetical protein
VRENLYKCEKQAEANCQPQEFYQSNNWEAESKNYYFNAFWHLVICQIKSKAAIIKHAFKFKENMQSIFIMY